MNNFKTLIFDLDGTLVDCKQLHQDGFRWAVTQQEPSILYTDNELEGLPTTEKIAYLRSKGYVLSDYVDFLKKEHTRQHIDKYVKYNADLAFEINLLSVNYKLCIASNSRSEFVFRCMNILQLWQFDCVLSKDYGPAKPNPWMYHKCMKITGSTPKTTAIFEDSAVGLQGATATGATVIQVTDSVDLLNKIKYF